MALNLLNRFSFAQKIWGGTLIFCLLVGAVSLVMLQTQNKVSASVRELISHDMEMLQVAQAIHSDVEGHLGALGLLLLTMDEQARQRAEQTAQQVRDRLGRLAAIASDGNLSIDPQLDAIERHFTELVDREKEIVAIAADPMRRLPGLAFAREQLSPHGTAATSLLSNLRYSLAAEGIEGEEALSLLLKLDDMRYRLARLSASIRAYLSFRDQGQVENVRTLIGETLAEIEQLLDGSELELDQEEGLTEAKEHLAAYAANFEKLLEIHSSQAWRQDSYRVRRDLLPLEAGLIEEVTDLVGDIRAHSAESVARLESTLDAQSRFTFILAGVGIGLGLLVMWAIVAVVKSRLNESVNALQSVAESGNLSRRLDEKGDDEVARLATYFNRFVAKIKGVVDLVIASSNSLASEASRMNEATQRSQSRVERQQQDITEIAESADHVAESATRVKESADAAAEAAADADRHAHEGQQVVQEVVGDIQSLATEVAEASEVIGRVQEDSAQIGMVLSVIRNISEQTNLLALNAAIEAARAGEHGRGFAVVADEVRTLSEKIHNETDQIQAIINQLQESSRTAVATMLRGTERSSEVAGKARSAGEALTGITASVSTISEMNRSIAMLSANQLERVQEVRSRIGSIREIAEEAAETSTQAAASAHEFTLMAMQLQDLVRQFLCEEGTDCGRVAPPTPTSEATAAPAAGSGDDIELF